MRDANDERLLTARVEDLYRLCDKYHSARFSPFLDEQTQRVIRDYIMGREGGCFFGGYDGSERKMFGVFPEWDDDQSFPITALEITHSFGAPLTHRDYLGSILALGIERGKIGDISIDGNTAYVFAAEDIAEYVIQNMKKVGNRGVKITVCALSDLVIPERKTEERSAVVSSLRLDAVLAAVMNVSRSIAAEYIKGGRVSLEHRVCENVSQTVAEGKLISVRGFGRFFVDGQGNMTRKGRHHIVVKKFI